MVRKAVDQASVYLCEITPANKCADDFLRGLAADVSARRAGVMSSPSITPAPLAPLLGRPDADAVLDRFLAVLKERGLELYAEQEETILELFAEIGRAHV